MKRGRERGSLPPGPRWPPCSLRGPQAVSLASGPHGTVSALSSFSAFALLDHLCVHWTFPASLECSALLVSAIPFPSSFFVSFPSLTLCPSITHFFLFLNVNIPCSGSHIRVLCAPLTLTQSCWEDRVGPWASPRGFLPAVALVGSSPPTTPTSPSPVLHPVSSVLKDFHRETCLAIYLNSVCLKFDSAILTKCALLPDFLPVMLSLRNPSPGS